MSFRHARLDRRRWALARRAIFERAGWRCERCGKAGRLECDHRVPLHDGGDPWDPENLNALCRHCHVEKSRGERGRAAAEPTPAVAAWNALVAERNDR